MQEDTATPAAEAPPPRGMRAALMDFEQGRFESAAERLEGLEGRAGPLEDYRLYLLAEALLLDERTAEALEVYDELSDRGSSAFAELVPWRRADALLASGDAGGAAAAYAALVRGGIPDVVDSASAHLNWGRALAEEGRVEEAAARYEHVMREFPHRPQADQAVEALARLRPGFRMGTEDRLARARRLRELKRPAAAEAELRAIEEKLPPDEAREVALSIARCVYAKRRAWAEAQALFEPLAKGGDAIAAESAYMVARCLHKRGRNEQAAAAYRRFLDRFKGSSLRDDAYMNLMVIDYEAGRFPAVRKNNLPLLRAGVWAGGDRGSALWMIAFSAYLEGELDEARELMDDYAAQATSEMSRLRSTYWGAVVRQEAGDGDAAARRYLEIASGHPLHYYALLSMRRLRDMDRELPDVDGIVGPPPAPAEAGCDELPPVVRALSGLGMHYHARREMSRHAAALVEEHVDEPAALVDIFGCAHAEKLLIRHAGAVEDEHEGGAATRVRWTLLYPTPYRDLVEEHAGESGVPPLLAMAVIRQESMFDPDATSVVRASGLMQLMPATARQVAGELDVSYDEDLLFDPETNITFGTHYLGGLIDRFPGNLPAAVAAYNGGPHNVSRWLASHAPVAGDVFVELVPFSQTRNYVRRVLTSYARYTYLETGSYERALGWVGRRMTGELGRGPDY